MYRILAYVAIWKISRIGHVGWHISTKASGTVYQASVKYFKDSGTRWHTPYSCLMNAGCTVLVG